MNTKDDINEFRFNNEKLTAAQSNFLVPPLQVTVDDDDEEVELLLFCLLFHPHHFQLLLDELLPLQSV